MTKHLLGFIGFVCRLLHGLDANALYTAVSPSELKAKWTSGMIQLSVFEGWGNDFWQSLYTAVVTSISAAPIGLWFARSQKHHLLVAGLYAVSFVIVLEAMQVGIESRCADGADAFWAAMGAVAGASTTNLLTKTMPTATTMRSYSQVANWLAAVAVICYAGLALAPFDWVDSKAALLEKLARFRSDILGGLLAGNDLMNASNLLRSLFFSILLGGVLGFTGASGHGGQRLARLAALGMLQISVCAGVELLQILSAQHNPSFLVGGVRILGGLLGSQSGRVFSGEGDRPTKSIL